MTGGPVGPEVKEPLALMVRDHADPAGQHAVVQNSSLGPTGPKVNEPLALLVLDHADPAGQHAATQSTTSLWERLPAQPEPPRRGGLVEQISDEEPTVCQVSGSALDSHLIERITYLEHPAQGVSLDSRPMEGSSCLEPVKQSILRSSQTERPRIGDRLVEGISDKEPRTGVARQTWNAYPVKGRTVSRTLVLAGRCLRPYQTCPARGARMLLMALLVILGRCPRRPSCRR